MSSSTTVTVSTSTTTNTTLSPTFDFPDIDESVAFISTDESTSMESSSSTASLSPSSSSSPNNDDEFISLRKKIASKFTAITIPTTTKRRVTFGLHHNVTRLIEPYTDSWLTKAELKAIRCGGLCDIESNKIYFQGYLQSVDAATIHILYSKEFHTKGHRGKVKPDDSQNQKVLMDTLTRILISGSNFGFRGLEHGSKDARHRRTGRVLAATAIVAQHRLLLTISKSKGTLVSKESQFRKFCEGLSYNSRIWAQYMAMIDEIAAMQEYATIPPLLLPYQNVTTKIPKIVVVPSVSQKQSPAKIVQRLLPTIHLLHSDHNSRRGGYQRLSHYDDDDDDDGSFPLEEEPTVIYTNRPRLYSRPKKTKTLFRKTIQRFKVLN